MEVMKATATYQPSVWIVVYSGEGDIRPSNVCASSMHTVHIQCRLLSFLRYRQWILYKFSAFLPPLTSKRAVLSVEKTWRMRRRERDRGRSRRICSFFASLACSEINDEISLPSFRFEGGGRHQIGRVCMEIGDFWEEVFLDRLVLILGLNRTGKSCRLQWVNYLHPGLKRSKMTPQEERLVLELHSQFDNRWSKIAQKLPGRTDNEIKNYWRTHMRKNAHEKKRAIPHSSSSLNSSSPASNNPTVDSMAIRETEEESFYDTGGLQISSSKEKESIEEDNHGGHRNGYSMDDIWKDIVM